MTDSIVHARIWRSPRPLTIRELSGDPGPTPGHVGVCLSGGSSRAMVAAMGQLRALCHLKANGHNLLSQVAALSVVSGGSWIGVPYTFLHGDVSDEDFLGVYVPPEELVPVSLPGIDNDRELTSLRRGNIGEVAANPAFSILGLSFCAAQLRGLGVADDELWQATIGAHVLEPYGLYESPRCGKPPACSVFALNEEQLNEIRQENPSLLGMRAHLVAHHSDPSRTRRPFLLCNGSMLLTRPDEEFQTTAPVQMTPVFTGPLGEPDWLDGNGRRPGGGQVASFAFDGVLQSRAADRFAIRQGRFFSLVDITGISSAFLAEPMRNALAHLESDPSLRESFTAQIDKAQSFLPDSVLRAVERAAEKLVLDLVDCPTLEKMRDEDLFVPAYRAISVGDQAEIGADNLTSFADGGYGDNTGIAGLLAYGDIDTVIAFVNAAERLETTSPGILDAEGNEVANSRILVSPQIPPLFGYQPHRNEIGYRLYSADREPVRREMRHNQVFEASAFPAAIRALWESSGGFGEQGAYGRPAIAKLRLRVLENRWYGVKGRGGPGDDNAKPITLVLVYLSRAREFYDRLGLVTRALLGSFDDPSSGDGFPHYSTLSTHLSKTKVNLLAHYTSWVVVSNADLFCGLFKA